MQWEASAIVTANANVVSCGLDSEQVLLDLTSSRYYSLNRTGAQIWEMMAEPTSVGELRRRFLDRFDVEAERGIRDLDILLTQFARSALIDVRHEQAA
ncbi:MAG: PqqD family protein [Sphingobium sp.]